MKLIGKMKDEYIGKPPLEFVGLRSKMHSLFTYDKNTVVRRRQCQKRRHNEDGENKFRQSGETVSRGGQGCKEAIRQ
jgi:hypothetical protein